MTSRKKQQAKAAQAGLYIPHEEMPDRESPWPVILFILAACLVRFVYLLHPITDSDVAVVGLMGMHVLDGDPSPLYWGQDYGGSQESLVAAGLFWLFGVNRHTLNAAASVISLFYLWGLYRLGRLAFNRRTALIALGLAAVGPYLLTWYSVQARGINIEVLAIGTWLLWAGLKAMRAPNGSGGQALYCALAGFLAGFGLWAHMLIVYFALPVGLLFLRRDPKLILRPAFWLMLAAFAAGSGPLWYYNITHDWGTYHFFMSPRPSAGFAASLQWLLKESAPVITGVLFPLGEGQVLPVLSPLAALLSAAAVLLALVYWGKDLFAGWLWKGQVKGPELCLLSLFSVGLVFCLLGGAASHSHRYLLSYYAVWPLVMGFFFSKVLQMLQGRTGLQKVAWGVLACLGLFYLYGSIATTPLVKEEERNKHAALIRQAESWVRFFKERHITYLYSYDYWDTVQATFDAKKQIILVQPVKDRQPKYLRALLQAPNYGFLVRSFRLQGLEEALHNMGATFKVEEPPGGFRAVYNIKPPEVTPLLLSGAGFSGTGTPNREDPAQAWDGNATTRWYTLGPQKPGQSLTLDLGGQVPGVCQVLLFSGSLKDLPARIKLYASRDGENWEEIAVQGGDRYPWVWSGGKPVSLERAPWQEMRFPPRRVRYLRLDQTGENPRFFWSVCELLVGVKPAKALPRPEPDMAAAWLQEKLPGPSEIWCGPALAARLPKRLLPRLNQHRRLPWLREYLDPALVLPPSRQLFALPANYARAAKHNLKACGWSVRSMAAHGYELLMASPPPEPTPARLLFSNLAPEKRGAALVLDLGGPEKLNRLALKGDNQSFLTPEAFELSTSLDGKNFQPVRFMATWPAGLYWAGIMPLAVQPYPLRLDFEARSCRYLRLEKTKPKGGQLPGILKLDLYGPNP